MGEQGAAVLDACYTSTLSTFTLDHMLLGRRGNSAGSGSRPGTCAGPAPATAQPDVHDLVFGDRRMPNLFFAIFT